MKEESTAEMKILEVKAGIGTGTIFSTGSGGGEICPLGEPDLFRYLGTYSILAESFPSQA